MANVILANKSLSSTGNAFSAVWGLTRAMKKAGWKYLASGDGASTKEITGVATADLWGGNADPALDTYPTAFDTTAAWWLGQGPSTLKIPVSTNSTGTFLRGEKITQVSSLAEGEIMGFMYDSATPANSFLSVLIRTGTFNGTDIITGASTGATITPSGTPVEYRGQVVFWKSSANTYQGSIYYTRASTVETAFSNLLSTTGCTFAVPPGGGGTGNAFPSTAFVPRGTGGSANHASFVLNTAPGNGKYQAVAANAAGATNVSPDGTFWLMLAYAAEGATASGGFGMFRMDDTEDGELDPFLWYSPGGLQSRTQNITEYNAGSWSNSSYIYGATGLLQGWRRRGFGTTDAFAYYYPATLAYYGTSGPCLLDTFTTVENIADHTQTIRVKEPVWALTRSVTTKHRKGTMRWWNFVPTGLGYDLWDTSTWVQVTTATTTVLGLLLGPWDGTSTPTQ